VKHQRRDDPRRVTPELLEFYKHRANRLRDEAYRNAGRALWAWLNKMVRRR